MKKYLLAVLVDNKPGVLTHVSGLISRRAFNIESISAGYTEEPDVTRINIVVSVESEGELDQVIQQLSKLIDVIKIVNLSEEDAIERELVLIKVAATRETRSDIINVVNIFRANIVDVTPEDIVIELTGAQRSTRSARSCRSTASSRLPAREPLRSPAAQSLSRRCDWLRKPFRIKITHASSEACVIFIFLDNDSH